VPGLYRIQRTTECSLHSLLIDILLPLLELSDFTVTLTAKASVNDEQVEAVAEKIVENQSRPDVNSRTSSGDNDPQKGSATTLPVTIDTRDVEEVKLFVLEVEKQIRATNNEFLNRGRVEIVIVEKISNLIKCVLEAKLCLKADMMKGFYQTCSEMIIGRGDQNVVSGIYSDYDNW
jgi:hypothetical protein